MCACKMKAFLQLQHILYLSDLRVLLTGDAHAGSVGRAVQQASAGDVTLQPAVHEAPP